VLGRPPFRSTLLAVSAGLDVPVGMEGSDVHLDLAVALRQMGLPGQALREIAAADAAPALEGLRLWIAGMCCHDLGAHAEAIAAFKQALHTRILGASAVLYVYYALASAHEALGDPREAVYYYERVRARRPRFLDVEARLRLARRQLDRAHRVTHPFGDDRCLAVFFQKMGLEWRRAGRPCR
jgi:tetratricopeptide (TPR) repeat protein